MAYWFIRHRYGERRWIYVISALLIIIIVGVFIYSRYSASREEAAVSPPDISDVAHTDTSIQKAEEPAPPVEAPPAAAPQPKPNLSQAAPTTPVDPNSRVTQLIAEAMSYLEATPARIIEARDRLNDTLAMPISEQQRTFVKEQLSMLADKWLFNRTALAGDKLCDVYEVQPGDLLVTIGKQFKVPYEIFMEINGITRPEALQAGQMMKVINGPFHARIYRSTFTMDLYLQNTFVRSFPVGLGKTGMETPTGLWVVKAGGKLIKPMWTDPISGRRYEPDDPDYPLGSRWIGLEGLEGGAVGRTGFAIHGTNNPQEIGMAGSQGCIRLHNGDAVMVYNLLEPVYSRVETVE